MSWSVAAHSSDIVTVAAGTDYLDEWSLGPDSKDSIQSFCKLSPQASPFVVSPSEFTKFIANENIDAAVLAITDVNYRVYPAKPPRDLPFADLLIVLTYNSVVSTATIQ